MARGVLNDGTAPVSRACLHGVRQDTHGFLVVQWPKTFCSVRFESGHKGKRPRHEGTGSNLVEGAMMAKMMQAASEQRPMCGCTRCDKAGRIKRRVRRAQRAREKSGTNRAPDEYRADWSDTSSTWLNDAFEFCGDQDELLDYGQWLETQGA